jgi:hypothetical protein
MLVTDDDAEGLLSRVDRMQNEEVAEAWALMGLTMVRGMMHTSCIVVTMTASKPKLPE